MSRKILAEPSVTLSDADIGSERVMSRRSLLGGLGLGAAAGAMLSASGAAQAAEKKKAKKPAKKSSQKKSAPAKPAQETDAD